MVILTDDQQNPMSQPTKQNILRAMHWLVKDARPNDALFFHYSGTCISGGKEMETSHALSASDENLHAQVMVWVRRGVMEKY